MTRNQISLAEHNENVRHNKETEKTGWYNAYSDALYKDRSGRAQQEQASAATKQASAAWYNAQTNARNADINWYNAYTGNVNKQQELGIRQFEANTKEQTRKDNKELAWDEQKRRWEQNQIEYKKAVNQWLTNLATVQQHRQANEIAKYDAKTKRSQMWFNAANMAMRSTSDSLLGMARVLVPALQG